VQTALDSVVQESLVSAEAKKSGKSVDSLLAAEAGPAGLDPSDLDITEWYRSNQGRVNGRTLDQVKPQIADLLRTERRKAAEKKLQDRLRAEHKVTVAYEPFRLQFNNERAPTLGKGEAPVTLVEFSDFQCPFCQAAAPTLKQVEQKFGDKVQIIYRQFPLTNIHPFAFKAAEASLCANEQGKFWPMHDAMFADQKKLAVSDLKQTARRLGMDGKKFDGCLDSGRYVEQIQNDQKEGQRIGVTGTPAMFINGTSVDGGAVPFSVLDGLIEKELAARQPKS
jgi:protein-disulfide isomerase